MISSDEILMMKFADNPPDGIVVVEEEKLVKEASKHQQIEAKEGVIY